MMYHPTQDPMPHGTAEEIEKNQHHHDRDAGEDNHHQHQRGPGLEQAEVGHEHDHHAERIPEALDRNVEQTVEAHNNEHDTTREHQAGDDCEFSM